MNTLFGDLAVRLSEFSPETEALSSMRRNRLKIIRLNRDDQMYEKGIDSRGDKIGQYADSTREAKKFKGQRYDHITLRDTQAFHKSLDVRFKKNSFEITADDRKESDTGGEPTFLTEVYGNEILGLTPDNLQFLLDLYVRPDMIMKLRARLTGFKI